MLLLAKSNDILKFSSGRFKTVTKNRWHTQYYCDVQNEKPFSWYHFKLENKT